MTAPAPLHGGFSEAEMNAILARACSAVGLDSTGAEVLRGHTNAVVRLLDTPVVVKIARKGTPLSVTDRMATFVRWLMKRDFPTVPLLPGIEQPLIVDQQAVTFWTYLPQVFGPVAAADLASPLKMLHHLPAPPAEMRRLDNIAAIRNSLSVTRILPDSDVEFLYSRADSLEHGVRSVSYALPAAVVQGDPQHRNALKDGDRTVLCDWDTIAFGQPEWDLVTIEIHCRRFGYEPDHYKAFADIYGFDVTKWSGYATLRDIRELRMITTNARRAHKPETVAEVRQRIAGLRKMDTGAKWNIL